MLRTAALLMALALTAGCASPGPPKAPSLQIPAVATGLEAARRDDAVELRFNLPAQTTDGLPYRGKAVHAALCRALENGTCVPVGALADVPFALSGAAAADGDKKAGFRDVLPADLATGAVRLLTYRVQLSNDRGRTAGYGDAAYAAAGAPPRPVAGLRAEGSRQGVEVRWASASAAGGGAVVLRRELVDGPATVAGKGAPRKTQGSGPPCKKKTGAEEPGVVWLSTSARPDPLSGEVHETAAANGANGVLDDGAVVGSTYRYAAERQLTVQLRGHEVVLHSALSSAVEVALRAVYPPPAPSDLVGTMFSLAPGEAGGKPGGLAVDLIWTPADDPQTVGYNVVREVVGSGVGVSSRVKLTAQPVKAPAFHDVLPPELANATGQVKLQYSVTAVDASGMESAAVVTVVER